MRGKRESFNLDIRIGLQRIAWGTGDELNPTDNLNLDDLEDIWDFGRHLGSNAIKASHYLGDFTLTAVFILICTPATLPIEITLGTEKKINFIDTLNISAQPLRISIYY